MIRLSGFLAARLVAYGLAEALFMLANLLPRSWALPLFKPCLALNPHHREAALQRALTLATAGDGEAGWQAFQDLLRQLKNPSDLSASDLFITWIPGRLARRIIARTMAIPAPDLEQTRNQALNASYRQLARTHFEKTLGVGHLERAAEALAAWQSLGGKSLDLQWSQAELAWRDGQRQEAVETVQPLVEDGQFQAPRTAEIWAERLLEPTKPHLAKTCLGHAQELLPTSPKVWRLTAALEQQRGDEAAALAALERAVALDPQDLEGFIAWQSRLRGRELDGASGSLELEAPHRLDLGATATVTCRWDGEGEWVLFVLPAPARGITASQLETPFDADGRARVELRARRPQRVHGGPWPVRFVAIGPTGYLSQRVEIEVPDTAPGEILVAVTEDHEIHEERELLTPDLLRRLLVDKSRFAVEAAAVEETAAPWTHFVETGSAMAMPAKAAESGDPVWQELLDATRDHLQQELARGNDLQPHLHAFNDPDSPDFPYRITADGWQPNLEFLLAAAEARGPWASSCPPPGRGAALDRFRSIERSVAWLEALARPVDPDYRAVVWRSGLLDFGSSPDDLAWSVAALRRAGLWADTDLPKPRSPGRVAVPPAFPTGWERPFEPCAGGPILQLPIVSNLEGDFVMGPGRLARRADACIEALRGASGRIRSGTHLFTLLTHDKFINARAGRDEFRLEHDYGDWRTIRQHLAAWKRRGASVVTASEGVRRVLDDVTWHPIPWLAEETFVVEGDTTQTVRYRVQWVGRGASATFDLPQHVLVTTPPSLRPLISRLELQQTEARQPGQLASENHGFWLRTEDLAQPAHCWFHLTRAIGPTLREVQPLDDGWRLLLDAPTRFLRARLLIPWSLLPGAPPNAHTRGHTLAAEGETLHCSAERDGVLIHGAAVHGVSVASEANTPDARTEIVLRWTRTAGSEGVVATASSAAGISTAVDGSAHHSEPSP
ncbi:MAG: hypothetical protein AAF560_20240 [Acidobacteriota bacterium]